MTLNMADAHETARARDAGCTTHFTVGNGWLANNLTGEFTRLDQESDTMTDHIATANDYRLVAHQELAIAEDILDRHDKSRGSAARHRVALAHASLAVDSRLAATLAVLTEIRDRLPERPTFHDLDDVAAEFGVDLSDDEPAPADVDPDEALARVIFGDGFSSHEGLRLAQLDVARAVREHIERESMEAHLLGERDNTLDEDLAERAERAETRLAAVTNERDKWSGLAHEADRNAKRHCDRADKAEADLARMAEERDALRRRVEAVVEYFRNHPSTELVPYNVARRIQRDVLDGHADERAESQPEAGESDADA